LYQVNRKNSNDDDEKIASVANRGPDGTRFAKVAACGVNPDVVARATSQLSGDVSLEEV
jgi:hypothetical protein